MFTIPLGPSVDLIKSPIAIAPINADFSYLRFFTDFLLKVLWNFSNKNLVQSITKRAFSAFSSSAPGLYIEKGWRETFLKFNANIFNTDNIYV